MSNILGMCFIIIGVGFNVFGCIGLIRLPDLYTRLQAAAKCVTLGTCSVLFGAFLLSGISQMGLKALLAMFFVLLTAPTAAHTIARGAHIYGIKLWEKSCVDMFAEEMHK